MGTYSLDASADTLEALRYLERGVQAITIVPGHPRHPGCSSCQIEASDGILVNVRPSQHDLEFKFEVFPLQAEIAAERIQIGSKPLSLTAPVAVSLLETEEWLDPNVPAGESLGEKPIMQCQDSPGSASRTATAVCRYVGGVELRGSNGECIVIATASFPYTLHVQGLAEDERFNRNAYAPAKGWA